MPLATLHCRYKIFLLHPFTYHTAVYCDRNLGLIIAIGLASITGFVKKKVCREKSFRLGRTRRLLWTRAGIYYSYASFDSYHRLFAGVFVRYHRDFSLMIGLVFGNQSLLSCPRAKKFVYEKKTRRLTEGC